MHHNDQKVLLVDDDATMLELLRHGLSANNDRYEVICANNAQEAIDFLERIHFPLVVSDIQMPTMSGLDLLAKIRERWPHVKVILMTAFPSRQLREDIGRSGCLRLFEKPIRMAELRALITKELAAFSSGAQGFAGRLTNIKLSDLIQMCCASGVSTVIQVRKNTTVGTIFIDEGEIIHADCGDMEGLNAFYEIFSWQSGSFETLGDVAVPKTTIDKNWQFLLMEGHRRMDEARDASVEVVQGNQGLSDESEPSEMLEDCLKLTTDDIGIDGMEIATEPENYPEPSRRPLRVLIVDDSAIMCRVLAEMLSSDETIAVVGTAHNGEEALTQIDQVRPDLITLDVNMPVMDGSTALKHIMIRNPCPVVIVSAVNHRHESNILNFLLLGAVDFIQKPVRGEKMARQRLIQAVRRAARAKTDRFRRARPPGIVAEAASEPKLLKSHHSLVLVCSGAGGYAELVKLIPGLPGDFQGSLTVMQTMSHSFQKPFAAYLNRRSRIQVQPFPDAMGMLQGHCYLTAGDSPIQLRCDRGIYALDANGDTGEDLSIGGMPDDFLASAAETFKGRLLVILLSGAETGSLEGLRKIWRRGGRIIAQDIRECLVPQPLEAAHEAGLVAASMGIKEIVSEMVHFSCGGAAKPSGIER